MTDITPAPNSVLADLKTNRERIQARKFLTLQIPGWDSLFVRYKSLTWETIRSFNGAQLENPTPNDELVVAWDTLIAACDEVLISTDDGLKPLADTPVRFEHRLAQLTGDDIAETPREVVDSVFPNEFAAVEQFGEYMTWLNFSSKDVSEDLGKVSNGTGG
jgi:hypothetical protein